MAVLKAAARNALPSGSFAGPGRSYPIEDENHAHAALSMLHNASPAVQARIRAAIKKKYPNILQAHDANTALVAKLRS